MSSCEVKNLKNTQMETPNEYLKRISPNDKYGIREHLQKERLRGVVENIMQKYAEYYRQQQLLIHSVVVPEGTLCDFYDHDKQIDVDGVCDKCGGQEKTNH